MLSFTEQPSGASGTPGSGQDREQPKHASSLLQLINAEAGENKSTSLSCTFFVEYERP